MRHFASRRFWRRFENLPAHVQRIARRNYELLKRDPAHPSLHFEENGKDRKQLIMLLGSLENGQEEYARAEAAMREAGLLSSA